jgi:tyrosyl-tRNA synthetase
VSRNEVAREVERQLEVMAEAAEQLVGADELRPRLEAALREDRPLRVKLGMDPSAPDLHLGHTLVLQKLKRFQDLGHLPIFLVGDFTARIGDPSGKKKTRPALDAETVRANAETYVDQVGKVLDVSRAELRFNSEWMDPMGAADVVRLCQRATVAQLLAREDFSQRYRAEEPIGVHELLYPLVQAYDSVALHADVELGGTDQTFNLLMGREIQRQYDQPPQAIVTHPLLIGTDGREKMSKSLNNGIGITEPPEEIYGKVMRISDELMLRWFDQLGFGEWDDLAGARDAVAAGAGGPLALKHDMARRVVARFHGEEAGEGAAAHFRRVVQRKELPEEIPEVRLEGESEGLGLLAIITQAGMAKSNSEARRLVAQRAVRLDGQAVHDPAASLSRGGPYLLQVGKRRVAHVWID